MNRLISLFLLYRPQGIIKASWTVLRILILPYKKLDSLIPGKGTIVDIGCGNGGFSNYISLFSSKRNVFGIDLSKKRIESAKKSIGKRNAPNRAHTNALTKGWDSNAIFESPKEMAKNVSRRSFGTERQVLNQPHLYV